MPDKHLTIPEMFDIVSKLQDNRPRTWHVRFMERDARIQVTVNFEVTSDNKLTEDEAKEVALKLLRRGDFEAISVYESRNTQRR